jgi:hypothetical protein
MYASRTLALRYSAGERAKITSPADELIAWPADVLVANVSSTAVELKKRTSSRRRFIRSRYPPAQASRAGW